MRNSNIFVYTELGTYFVWFEISEFYDFMSNYHAILLFDIILKLYIYFLKTHERQYISKDSDIVQIIIPQIFF